MELKEKPYYDSEFVKMVKEADERGEYTTIDTDDVWGSLGLSNVIHF